MARYKRIRIHVGCGVGWHVKGEARSDIAEIVFALWKESGSARESQGGFNASVQAISDHG